MVLHDKEDPYVPLSCPDLVVLSLIYREMAKLEESYSSLLVLWDCFESECSVPTMYLANYTILLHGFLSFGYENIGENVLYMLYYDGMLWIVFYREYSCVMNWILEREN